MTAPMLPQLRWVGPGGSCLNVRDRLLGNAELHGNLVLRDRTEQLPNLAYISPGERGQSVVFSSIGLMVADPIWTDVLGPGTPAEVDETCVQLATRAVPSLLSLRARANEGLKHQVMYACSTAALSSTLVQVDLGVSVLPDVLHEQVSTANTPSGLMPQRAHTTEVTDFVQALPSGDRSPLLFHELPEQAGPEVYS